MVNRSFILVVLVLCSGLTAPAASQAAHPWDPPAWWAEVNERGEPRYDERVPHADCVLRHSESTSHGEYGQGWDQRCLRSYPAGVSDCVGYRKQNSGGYHEYWFQCQIGSAERGCVRRDTNAVGFPQGDTGWIDRDTKEPRPECFSSLNERRFGPDDDGDGIDNSRDRCPQAAGPVGTNGCPVPASDHPSGAAGHDLVSLCGTARFDWYRTGSSEPDVEKGEEACIHTVSNRVAQQLAVDGLKKMPELFGRRLVEFVQGKLVPDPEDLIQRALPAWDRAFRVAGRLNVITRIGEAAGIAGVALGKTWMVNQIANRDACVMFITSMSTNLSLDGVGSSSFEIDGWNVVYNRKSIHNYSKRDAYRHTAHVRQKKKRVLLDKYEQRLTSMRCGKGGKVFLAKKHDEKKIVSNRVRAAG